MVGNFVLRVVYTYFLHVLYVLIFDMFLHIIWIDGGCKVISNPRNTSNISLMGDKINISAKRY